MIVSANSHGSESRAVHPTSHLCVGQLSWCCRRFSISWHLAATLAVQVNVVDLATPTRPENRCSMPYCRLRLLAYSPLLIKADYVRPPPGRPCFRCLNGHHRQSRCYFASARATSLRQCATPSVYPQAILATYRARRCQQVANPLGHSRNPAHSRHRPKDAATG